MSEDQPEKIVTGFFNCCIYFLERQSASRFYGLYETGLHCHTVAPFGRETQSMKLLSLATYAYKPKFWIDAFWDTNIQGEKDVYETQRRLEET